MSRAKARRTRNRAICVHGLARGWLSIVTACCWLAAAAPAQAGFCAEPTQSGFAEGLSKTDAEKAAIVWWASRAGALGRGYENWDNAAERKIDCREHTNGHFTCQATARPCLPDGVAPENDPRIHL